MTTFSQNYIATLYVNNVATNLIATISNGSVNYKILVEKEIELNSLDLISIKITFNNGALSKGVTCSLVVSW